MFFKKRKLQQSSSVKPIVNYYFTHTAYDSKYPFSEDEQKFFDELCSKSKGMNQNFQLERMANGEISVYTHNGFVGKVRLCKKKHWMLVLTNLYDNKIIEGSVDDFIQAIDLWLKYIKKYL